jgi:hypothetical protein
MPQSSRRSIVRPVYVPELVSVYSRPRGNLHDPPLERADTGAITAMAELDSRLACRPERLEVPLLETESAAAYE